MKILQIAGYKNSGKTSLIEEILSASRKAGLRVGVIKHHGHEGDLESPDGGKDTCRYRGAGAAVSGIATDNQLQMQLADDAGWEIHQIVAFYEHLPLDLILIEGFKQAAFPKIVMVKGPQELEALRSLRNIKLFVSWEPLQEAPNDIPVFGITEKEKLMTHIMSALGVEPVE